MTTADAILADILGHPDDDVPRLIYADWLDEHGEAERAEFIRVQIELANPRWKDYDLSVGKLLRPTRSNEWDELKKQERRLLQSHADAWVNKIVYPLNAVEGFAWQFRRGFLEMVRLPSGSWLHYGDTLTKSAPIHEVNLITPLSELPNPPYPTPQDMFGGLIFNFDLFQHGSVMSRVPPEIVEREGRLGARWYATIKVLSQMWPGIEFTVPRDAAEFGPQNCIRRREILPNGQQRQLYNGVGGWLSFHNLSTQAAVTIGGDVPVARLAPGEMFGPSQWVGHLDAMADGREAEIEFMIIENG